MTSIVANIDGGQPWRRGYGEALTFTDWTRDNFFVGVQELVAVKGCIGVEFDHMNLEMHQKLQAALPGIGMPSMKQCMLR